MGFYGACAEGARWAIVGASLRQTRLWRSDAQTPKSWGRDRNRDRDREGVKALVEQRTQCRTEDRNSQQVSPRWAMEEAYSSGAGYPALRIKARSDRMQTNQKRERSPEPQKKGGIWRVEAFQGEETPYPCEEQKSPLERLCPLKGGLSNVTKDKSHILRWGYHNLITLGLRNK